jgi:hypothetical protein
MLLSAAFGFIIGEACGDNFRHRKCLEQANEDLQEELAKTHANDRSLLSELKQQRDAISDIHDHLLPGSKGSTKLSS